MNKKYSKFDDAKPALIYTAIGVICVVLMIIVIVGMFRSLG
jgi:hypothetical protein